MRIIAGEFRRRVLSTPPDDTITRPIPDRVKESLFNLLRGHCEDASVYDGFAGTGAIGLEAVSRGAAHCVFVEQDKSVAAILRKNVEMLNALDRCEVVQGDALGAGGLARVERPLTLGFLDPPYPLVREPIGLKRVLAQVEAMVDILSEDGFVVLRTPWPLQFEQVIGSAPIAAPAPEDEEKKFKKRGKGSGGRRAAWKLEELAEREARWKERNKRKADAAPAPAPIIDPALDPFAEFDGESDDGLIIEQVGTPVPTPAAKPEVEKVYIQADLRVPNAIGPETHEYTGMAIHLYGKRKANG
jgi:16S rRNA (guanine966-N2)-methyltransferase